MKKTFWALAALVWTAWAPLQAQTTDLVTGKWDAAVDYALTTAAMTQGLGKSGTVAMQKLILKCTDAGVVTQRIADAGYEATAIDDATATATVPVSYIHTLGSMQEVLYMNAEQQLQPWIATARTTTKANAVLAGEGLETPFTGKGVIIGVIDQSFEYRHRAFLDSEGMPRTLAVWNRRSSLNRPTSNIPTGGDGYAGGHATHVTNIACGSVIEGSDLHGMAPEADIIMISSSFGDAEVLEDTKYIRDFAAEAGKPFVINMSFGGHVGPHDGTTTYCRAMDNLAGPGGILVAAMGNDGNDKIHASYTFSYDDEDVNLYVKDDGQSANYVNIWCQTADSALHITVRPFLYNTTTKARDYKSDAFWSSCGYVKTGIDPNNKKQYYSVYANMSAMRGSETKYILGVTLSGETDNTFHAWAQSGYGQFYKPLGAPTPATPDNLYTVGEGAATINRAIAVGSYNAGSNKFVNYVDGKTYSFNSGNLATKGAISGFSNRGPFLGTALKPMVVAPGAVVNSALNGKASDFSATDLNQCITGMVTYGTGKYYYGIKTGTSMAAPAVSGIVALWLQANPTLTPEDIETIISQTAIRDGYTGIAETDYNRGYGKIDAYEGLRVALQMAETGIHDPLNSDTPVTLQKNNDSWRILFNNDESYAHIALYGTGGRLLQSRSVDQPRRGDETVVSLSGLTPGVYFIRIQTTRGALTRKVMVH